MSSNKRQRVPAGLHAELSDYAHALRALRTNNALDVTSQLISSSNNRFDGAAFESDPEFSDEQPPVRTTEQPVASGSTPSTTKKRARREQSTSKKPVDAGNTWSRWPLPPEELKESEWDFSEEVQAIARQSMAAHAQTLREAYETEVQTGSDDAALSDGEDFDALDHTSLVNMASDQLERILAALVSFAPAAAEQWSNRFSGISWEAVLHAISAAEIMDASVIERAQTRLEGLYGPAELPIASRATLLQNDAQLVDEFERGFNYLSLPYPKLRTLRNAAEKDEDDDDEKKPRKHGRRRNVTNRSSRPPEAEDVVIASTPHMCDSDSDVPLAQRFGRRRSSGRSVSRATSQSQPPEPMEVDEVSPGPQAENGRRRSARLATPAPS